MTNTTKSMGSRLLGVVLTLVVVASACGDDSDAAGGLSFCELAVQQDELADTLSFSAGPEEIERFYTEQRRLTAAGIAAAPNGQVKADLETLARGVDGIIAALRGVDWNFSALSDEAFASFDTPEFNDAADRIDAFSASECGIDTDEVGTDGFDTDGLADDGADFDATDLGADLGDIDLEDLPIPDLDGLGELSAEQTACLFGQLGTGAIGEIMAAAFAGQEIDPSTLSIFTECGIDAAQFGG